MTTIVWKPPFMAADGRCTIDNLIFTDKCSKIYKLSSGALMGFSGALDSRPIVKLFDHVKTPKSFPEIKAIKDCQVDFRALLVLPNRSIFLVEAGPDYTDSDGNKHINQWQAYITELNEPYAACGSGGRWAKGALDFGASADQAVRIAMKNDAWSGGKVQVVKLEEKPLKKVIK